MPFRIWLPSEVWVDVFKFLARRVLLRRVQPACRRFHALAEHHVDNLHVVRHFGRFLDELACNLPDACMQFAELAASDASLAEHFRLKGHLHFRGISAGSRRKRRIQQQATQKRQRHAQMCVLRHSLDLFRGCRLHLLMSYNHHNAWANDQQHQMDLELLADLAVLQPIRPCYIGVMHSTEWPELQLDLLLCKPTMLLSCLRLVIDTNRRNMPSAGSICNWLHHHLLPAVEDEEEKKQQVDSSSRTRIFILEAPTMMPDKCAEIVECCKKLLKQSESLSDRRAFLFNFYCETEPGPDHNILASNSFYSPTHQKEPFRHPQESEKVQVQFKKSRPDPRPGFWVHPGQDPEPRVRQEPFRLDHPLTGEVLSLEPSRFANHTGLYHLRRCPVTDLATTDQFYDSIFRNPKAAFFRTPVRDGVEAPILTVDF